MSRSVQMVVVSASPSMTAPIARRPLACHLDQQVVRVASPRVELFGPVGRGRGIRVRSWASHSTLSARSCSPGSRVVVATPSRTTLTRRPGPTPPSRDRFTGQQGRGREGEPRLDDVGMPAERGVGEVQPLWGWRSSGAVVLGGAVLAVGFVIGWIMLPRPRITPDPHSSTVPLG